MTGRRLLAWAGLVAAVVVAGVLAGVLFARSAPDVAARQLVREFIQVEQVSMEVLDADATAPTSGGNTGSPFCGTRDDRDVDDIVATLDSGRVVVHAGNKVAAARVSDALAAVDGASWAVVVDDRIKGLVATAWGVRMELSRMDARLLRAFVTGYAGQRGLLSACPA